jgi:hypothetical protein
LIAVFDIDLGDGKPPRKLGYNANGNTTPKSISTIILSIISFFSICEVKTKTDMREREREKERKKERKKHLNIFFCFIFSFYL